MKFKVCKSYNRTCPCCWCKERYKCSRACNEQKHENGIVVDTDLLCYIAKDHCEKTNYDRRANDGDKTDL